MGVTGGLVFCPNEMGIMIIAIGLNCILLVRSRSLLERFGGLGGRWSSDSQLRSAVIVTALRVDMMANGLATYLA